LRSRAARESRRSSSRLSAIVVAFILESAMKGILLLDRHAWSKPTADRHAETAARRRPLLGQWARCISSAATHELCTGLPKGLNTAKAVRRDQARRSNDSVRLSLRRLASYGLTCADQVRVACLRSVKRRDVPQGDICTAAKNILIRSPRRHE
jgi:hypothetical protein